MIRFALAIAGFAALTACNTVPPEPITKVVTVTVPVTSPCKATTPAEPVYPDPDAATDILDKVKRLSAGLSAWRTDARSTRQTLQACISPVKP